MRLGVKGASASEAMVGAAWLPWRSRAPRALLKSTLPLIFSRRAQASARRGGGPRAGCHCRSCSPAGEQASMKCYAC